MATFSQVADYIRENITIWTEDDEVFIKNFENCVRQNGTGMYIIEFSRGDMDYDKMSDANDLNDIFEQDPDYFVDTTTPEEFENGILLGEEQVYFNITSLD